jgi:hypothetical protein
MRKARLAHNYPRQHPHSHITGMGNLLQDWYSFIFIEIIIISSQWDVIKVDGNDQ